MKKFLAISASAVMALSVFAFSACDPTTDNGAENLTYTEVDLSTPEKKAEFLEELTANIDPQKLMGDMTAEGYSFGMAGDFKFGAEISATAKDMPVSETETKDLSVSAKVDLNESVKYKYAAEKVLMSSETKVEYKTTIPEELYAILASVGAPQAVVDTLKAVLPSGNYKINEYTDGQYLYVEYPTSIIELLPEEAQGFLPAGGKLKVSFADLGNMGGEGDYEENVSSTDESVGGGMEQVSVVDYIFELLATANVKVSVSKENGYALKISADKASIINLVKMTPAGAYWTQVEQIATFNNCAVTAYFAVDADGMFKEATVKAELDVKADLSAELAATFVEGLPAMNGSVKLNVEASVKKYDGAVTLPTDLDSYVDILAGLGE